MKRIRKRLEGSGPSKWLFYGDSITQGVHHTQGGRDYTQHFAEYVRFTMGRGQDVVINTALSCNTSRDLLETFDWRVAQFSPDIVFVMIGMNDCATGRVPIGEFRTNLELLVSRVEQGGGFVVLQTTNLILAGQDEGRAQHLPAFMDVVREVAFSRRLPLIDHANEWRADQSWAAKWMNDGIHPNAEGHRQFADFLLRCLGQNPSLMG